MSNNLEKFIQKNRRDFDSELPADKVWEAVEKTIPVQKEAKRFSIKDIYKWSAAAAILFVILTSVYFLYIRKYSHENTTAGTDLPLKNDLQSLPELNGIDPEYAVQFKKFYESIESSQIELKKATTDQPSLYKQFEEDLKVLDSSYTALKNQAGQSPNPDVLIKAMIQNLQLQTELLGRQLMIIKEIKNNQTQTHKNEKII